MAVQVEDVWCVALMSEDGIRGRVYPDGRVEDARRLRDRLGEWFERAVTEDRATVAGLVWLGVGFFVGALRALGVISLHTAKTVGAWWIGSVVVLFVLVFLVPLAWGWISFVFYCAPVGTWRWLRRRRAR
jgi:hypothetical protein